MEHKIYQAREIMKVLEISRPTFDYSAQKVGISADIKKAQGPGTTNLYSFKALLSFAIAQACLGIGWSHTPTTKILNELYEIDEKEKMGIFNYSTSSAGGIKLWTLFNSGAIWFELFIKPNIEDDNILFKKQVNVHIKGNSAIFVKKVDKKFLEITPHAKVFINIGQIKKDLIARLGKEKQNEKFKT